MISTYEVAKKLADVYRQYDAVGFRDRFCGSDPVFEIWDEIRNAPQITLENLEKIRESGRVDAELVNNILKVLQEVA